ncbi:MAG: GMC family oxidoreductase [Nostoc sp. TH1S01]|nr:GMC family oxidoreductase [Nostoc sp. TH1S01]
MSNNHYDFIIIGTGAGGGTLAYKLAPSDKKILVLEQGTFLPKEKTNWDTKQILQKGYYRTSDVWYDQDAKPINPAAHYYVGGNTKFYGGALFRLREKDFDEVIHQGGISPAWPLKYQDFAPYYDQAEKLYEVHGQRGLDPTEPPTNCDYPFPAISHEPYIDELYFNFKNQGLHPFYLPLAIKLNEVNRYLSACIRCDTCDGFPCMIHAKGDAEVNGIRPAIAYNNLTLITQAKVVRLHTSASGREVTEVEAEIKGQKQIFSGNIIVVAGGAINSAALLLKSANDKHPQGLANSSQLVGRNYMVHNCAVVMTLSTKPNPTVFPKTLAFTDFYWGEKDFHYPMGSIQSLGNIHKDRIIAYGPPLMPNIVAEKIANHSLAWWVMNEDLPDENNRVSVQEDKIFINYKNNNQISFNRLIQRWITILKSLDQSATSQQFSLQITQNLGLDAVGHQCGTCRFGENPQTSVLDINCRTHDVDNLYVVDGSFFPSSAAVNPSLTIMANALRVGEHLLARIK